MLRLPESFAKSVVPTLAHSASFALHLAVLGGAALYAPSPSFAQQSPQATHLYSTTAEADLHDTSEEATHEADAQNRLAPSERAPSPQTPSQHQTPPSTAVVPPADGVQPSEHDAPYEGMDSPGNIGFDYSTYHPARMFGTEYGSGGGPRHLEFVYTLGGPPVPPKPAAEPAPKPAPKASAPWSCPKSIRDRKLVLCRKTYSLKQHAEDTF